MGSRVFFVLLILSPLLYTFVDDLIQEKVVAVALLSILFFVLISKRLLVIYGKKEIIVISLFSLMAILQQFFIDEGSIVYGAKYAIFFFSTFIPYWLARSLRTGEISDIKFENFIIIAIWILFFTVVITVFSSYLFGWGEVYDQSSDGVKRAFGWLSDSITPVLVFFILLYFFLRNYLALSIALIALLMTGGKAGVGMLIVSPFRFVFFSFSMRIKITLIVVYLALLLLLSSYSDPIFELLNDNPRFVAAYNNRILSVYAGLDYFYNNLFFGIGVVQATKRIQSDTINLASQMGIINFYPVNLIHNAIINVAAELGVFGLILLFCFFYIVFRKAFRSIEVAKKMPNTRSRSIVLASSTWVISFILVYQTTGWFVAGHPQLSWLLMFSTLSEVFYRRWAISNALS